MLSDTEASSREISVVIPAESRFVALTRVAAVSLAADLDFTVDELEDLRIAVDELVTLLVEAAAPDGTVELTYLIGVDTVGLNGATRTDTDLGQELDALTRQILDAVVDTYAVGRGTASMVKRRSA